MHEDAEPDKYLGLVGKHGEEVTNRAWNNTPPLRVFGVGCEELAYELEDADFLCVMVDDRLKLRRDFIEELKRAG